MPEPGSYLLSLHFEGSGYHLLPCFCIVPCPVHYIGWFTFLFDQAHLAPHNLMWIDVNLSLWTIHSNRAYAFLSFLPSHPYVYSCDAQMHHITSTGATPPMWSNQCMLPDLCSQLSSYLQPTPSFSQPDLHSQQGCRSDHPSEALCESLFLSTSVFNENFFDTGIPLWKSFLLPCDVQFHRFLLSVVAAEKSAVTLILLT